MLTSESSSNHASRVSVFCWRTAYYPLALLLAGGVAGLVPAGPLRFWFWLYPAGIFGGQLIAILARSFTHPPAGANLLFSLGVVFLAAGSLVSLCGRASGGLGTAAQVNGG